MSMSTYTPGAATAPPVAADPFAAFTESFAPKRAVSYLRVSTREQAERGGREEGFSIPAQRDANKKKATSIGAMVVKEFVERGVSGTSTNRPALQAMLRYLEEEQGNIDYVIVHKLDRLARNRADDVEINSRFNELGIRLISTSENIDQTPGGMLLHGIMSSIAEFYSRNLANEVLKGMNEKVKAGGSVGRAPIGYLNVRTIENGTENRTVAVDTERAPHIKWAFETYAQGGWTVAGITEELHKRGLTTVPTPKMAEGPVGTRQIHGMLKNPFYTGIVTFKGANYPGRHEVLVDSETFDRVQIILASKLSGERSRKHDHYLKSTVFCGNCGSRLMVQHNRSGGNGEIYEYYSCTGRHAKRTSCKFRAIQIQHLEKLIEEIYSRISVDPALRRQLESLLRVAFKEIRRDEVEEREGLEMEKLKLQRKQDKLLEAHYNDAIPLDVLGREQKKLNTEMNRINRDLAARQTEASELDRLISIALEVCENMVDKYRQAPPLIRRLLNQLVFERLNPIFDEDDGVWNLEAEYKPEFVVLQSAEIRALARRINGQNENLTQTGEVRLDLLAKTDFQQVISLCNVPMVDLRGFEPLTPCMPCRCATNCATDPWKSEECSPDNPSTLHHQGRTLANSRGPRSSMRCRSQGNPSRGVRARRTRALPGETRARSGRQNQAAPSGHSRALHGE